MALQNKRFVLPSFLTSTAVIALSLAGIAVLADNVHANHKICIGSDCENEKHREETEWTEWTSTDSLPEIGGNYYLAEDITLTNSVTVAEGVEISLCLNGHNVVVGQNQTDIKGVFNLCDCKGSGALGTCTPNDKEQTCKVIDINGGVFNMYSGNVSDISSTEETRAAYLVYVGKGEFNMYGGTVSDSLYDGKDISEGGVYIGNHGGSFKMYGGKIKGIKGNLSGVDLYGVFEMYGGEITENTSTYYGHGGGINIHTDAAFKMYGGSITKNTASFGGGICNDGDAEIYGGTISENKAVKDGTATSAGGGGIYSWKNLKIENCNILNNYSEEDGGGIYSRVAKITIKGGIISNNKAQGNGGGIYTFGYGNVEISDVSITENTAYDGGGIFNEESNTMKIENADISANTSKHHGGGIYSGTDGYGDGDTKLEMENSNIINNTAGESGGGVYLSDNNITTMNGGTISGNTAVDGQGGGIYALGNPHIDGLAEITGNTADNADNNVYLFNRIIIEENFNKASVIGISIKDRLECGQSTEITSGESREELTSAFHYDDTESRIRVIWIDNKSEKSEVGLENPHDLTNYPAKEPDCIKEGNIEFDLCSICNNALYYDAEVGEYLSLHFDINDDYVKNKLFISPIGKHLSELTHIEHKPATCTEKGNKEHWICERCGSKFGSEDGGELIYNNDIEIAAKGHIMIHHDKVLPNCTEEGIIEYWECSECKGKFSDEDGKNALADNIRLPALGHDLIYYKANEPTCTKEGNKEYWQCSRCGIMFDSSDDDKNEMISDDIIIPVKEHIWETDYNQDFHWNVCLVCGTKDDNSIKEHKYDGGKITKPATCTNDGEVTYTCEDCSHTKTETLRKLSHIIIEELQYNEDYHWEECRNCHQHLQEEVHKWDNGREDPDKNVKVYSCEKCSAEKTEALEPKPEKTTAQETDVTTKQETEVTTLQETEVTTGKETEVTTMQETEVTTKQEAKVTTMQETEVTSKQETEETSVQGIEVTSENITDVMSEPSAETTQATSNVNNGNDNENNDKNMSTGIVLSVIPMITALAAAVVLKRRR